MIKSEELSNPNSCLNRAADDEMIFVLRAKDICAPYAILFWILSRVSCGKNEEGDEQIKDAQKIAEGMFLSQKQQR